MKPQVGHTATGARHRMARRRRKTLSFNGTTRRSRRKHIINELLTYISHFLKTAPKAPSLNRAQTTVDQNPRQHGDHQDHSNDDSNNNDGGTGFQNMMMRPQLKKINPGLIYASTSGFGQTGPYRNRGAVDIIVQAMGGLISTTGHKDDPLPSKAGYSIGDMASGLFTAVGVLSALVERAASGLGQHVDVSMLDSQVALMENPMIRHLATGEVQERMGLRHPLNTPHQLFPAEDGWVAVAGVKDTNWQLFLGKLGLDEYVSDERFLTGPFRTQNYQELEPILFAAFRKRSVSAWLDELQDHFLIGPVNSIADVAIDPQVNSRDMLVSLPTWTGGEIVVSNTPVKLSRTPGGAVRGASKPGEHTRALLSDAGFSEDAIDALIDAGVIGIEPVSAD